MSKTDTVARFSLIFARFFGEQFSSREFSSKTGGQSLSVVKDHDAVRRAWKVECTGQRQVSAWCARAWCAVVL